MHRLPVVFALVFAAFAALQWNDPDPLTWISLYGAAALLCLLACRGRLRRIPAGVSVAAYVLGAAWIWPAHFEGLGGTMEGHPAVEEARESIGLLLCALAVGASFFMQRKRGG